ncbi:RodZ domain-containing protein [Paraglaciecola sp.]|uniref:RodZ domain-containing protein n=1 Tax=Paraglaciecola sp. TaxID=1920173 RepID=UPI0030F3D65C
MSEELEEQTQISPGQILKDARVALNLTTQQIADKVRLKNSLIQDIEADNYDLNISLTFLKGYLKLYAKQVGIQPELVINAFDNSSTQKKEPAKLQSFSKRIANQAHDDKLMLVTYLIVGVVIALVVIWWFQQSSSTTSSTVINSSSKIEKAKASPRGEVKSINANIEIVNDDSMSSDAQQETLAEESLSEPENIDPQVEQSSANNIASSAVFELAPSRQGIIQIEEPPIQIVDLVFTFANDCWMKLSDATGEDIAYGTKVLGRVMPVSGTPPFSVVLCSPEVVKISYDGQVVDLSGFRQGVTAKFNLPFTE